MSKTPEVNEHRVYGPPGTGKTSWITRRVRAEVDKRRTGQGIMITSLTKSAAQVIAGKDLPIPAANVGTLHSHCYKALGGAPIAETKIVEFNSEFPKFRLSAQKKTRSIEDAEAEDERPGGTLGDRLFTEYNFARSTMMDTKQWRPPVRAFSQAWELWKEKNGFRDFTDLIELSYRGVAIAPGDPAVIFVDEAQDHDRLELSLIRKWARYAEVAYIVGDADQSIYEWRGADPAEFTRPQIDDEKKTKLQQSHRVPRLIHDAADSWIRQIRHREVVEYKAKINQGTGREEAGVVRRLRASYRKPFTLLKDVESQLARNRETMILASSSFMVERIIMALKKEGIPFSNRYRKANKLWNPLAESKGNSPTDRILAFLRPLKTAWKDDARIWNHADLLKWMEPLKAEGILKRGAKTLIKSYSNSLPVPARQLVEYFEAEALQRMIQCDLDWYLDNVLPAKRNAYKFPARVIQKHTREALGYAPLLTVGTIHSVKGGEAQTVYILPDLAPSAYAEWCRPGASKESLIRLYYVAMTRASEELVICDPASSYRVSGLGK